MADEILTVTDDDLQAYVAGSDDEGEATSPTRASSPSSCEGKAALVKRPWTPEEDEALIAAVKKYGACRWSMIATHLSTGRVGKQCRERWNNHLCPHVKKTEWSEDEDRAILEGVAVLGTRWCEIIKAPALVGRTDNAIKNRFYSLQRRMRSRQLGGKPPGDALGKRLHDDNNECLAPGQRERIVSVATELAFATDEQDRDRLIAELTGALQEGCGDDDQASDLGTLDSPDSLRQLGCLAQLSFASDATCAADLAADLELARTASDAGTEAVADVPATAPAPAIKRVHPLEDIDTSRETDSVAPLSVPTPASAIFHPSPGFSAAESTACGEMVDEMADALRAADEMAKTAMHPSIVPLSDGGSPLSPPSRHQSPTGGTLASGGTSAFVASPPGRSPLGKENRSVSPGQQREATLIGASLGGRHAYKALLSPLCIPQDGACGSPMKRMRTPSGAPRTTAFPFSTEPARSHLMAGASRRDATGTEEPGVPCAAAPADDQPISSPMAELLNLSLFTDLFTEGPCTPAEPPSCVEKTTPAPAAPPPGAAMLAAAVMPEAESMQLEPSTVVVEEPTHESSSPSTPALTGDTSALAAAPLTDGATPDEPADEKAPAKSGKGASRFGTEEPTLQRGPRRSARGCGRPPTAPNGMLVSPAGVC